MGQLEYVLGLNVLRSCSVNWDDDLAGLTILINFYSYYLLMSHLTYYVIQVVTVSDFKNSLFYAISVSKFVYPISSVNDFLPNVYDPCQAMPCAIGGHLQVN